MKALILLFFVALSTWLLLGDPLETLIGVPSKITRAAFEQPGLWQLLTEGSAEDRHRFAKGQWTKYGQLPFDSDAYMRSRGYSESELHKLGARYGFSERR